MICPVKKINCPLIPQCTYNEGALLGQTMCVEWIKIKQAEGIKDVQRQEGSTKK